MKPTKFTYGVGIPNATEDNTKVKIAAVDDDGVIQSYITEIPVSMLPSIAITSIILAPELTITDFAANSGSYTFEKGDVVILDNGNSYFFMYNGGVKTNVNSYNQVTASEIDWSQVINTPTTLSGYGIADAYTKTEIDTDFLTKTGDGTNLTNVAVLDAENNFTKTIYINNSSASILGFVRNVSFSASSGGWVRYLANFRNTLDINSGSFNIGVFGGQNEYIFTYIGYNEYNSEQNLRIYKDDIKWGNSSIFNESNLTAGTGVTITEPTTGNYEISADTGLPAGFYDEGTFTPILTDQGGGATYTFTTDTAEFVRSGNAVTVNIKINSINTTGTPTSFLRLGSTFFDTHPPIDDKVWAAAVNTFYGGSVNFYSISAQFGEAGFFFEYQNALDANKNSVMSSNTITSGVIHVSLTYKTNVYTP